MYILKIIRIVLVIIGTLAALFLILITTLAWLLHPKPPTISKEPLKLSSDESVFLRWKINGRKVVNVDAQGITYRCSDFSSTCRYNFTTKQITYNEFKSDNDDRLLFDAKVLSPESAIIFRYKNPTQLINPLTLQVYWSAPDLCPAYECKAFQNKDSIIIHTNGNHIVSINKATGTTNWQVTHQPFDSLKSCNP